MIQHRQDLMFTNFWYKKTAPATLKAAGPEDARLYASIYCSIIFSLKTPETQRTLIDTRKSRAVLRYQISIVQLTRLYIKKTGPSSLLRHVGPI